MDSVRLDAGAIHIEGRPRILLCASLFYFRIPREDWGARMEQLRAAGYNCVDVYFPWNFHELRPGEWHFEDMHDADAFLTLAARHDLYVIARPGPYICSEWDGGALPAWLYQSGMPLRQDDPAYLRQLNRWLERILPIIAAHEAGRGGSVVAVQLENEMDFYGCADPGAYMAKLRETARLLGITVPVVACAGQCDVQGACGDVPDVYPAFNAYSDDGFAHLEAQLAHMRALAAAHGAPLMITETDRGHDKIKRELLSGVKLISPYNQVGGSDIDMTNGISNWAEDARRPLALMASDYDFCSMITVDGRLRPEAGKARLVGSLICSLGEHLAAAEPCAAPVWPVCDFPTARMPREDGLDEPCFPALKMDCGWLFGVSNLGASEGAMRFATEDGEASVRLAPGETKALPWRLSLAPWSADAEILWAEAEICSLHAAAEDLRVTLTGDAQARAMLRCGGEKVPVRGEEWICAGNGVWARILPPEKAWRDCPLLPPLNASIPSGIRTQCVEHLTATPFSLRALARPLGEGLRAMEAAGVYRGDVFYEFESPDDAPLLFKNPADFLWVRHDGAAEARFCDGSGVMLDGCAGAWSVRAQSWGHVNFDDVRQPSLKMGSAKGIAGVVRVVERQDVTDLWLIYPEAKYLTQNRAELRKTDRILATTINSWSYPASPMRADFVRRIHLRPDCDSFWLHVERGNAEVTAWVDGVEAGRLRPNDPYLELSPVRPGSVELRLNVTRRFSHESLGAITLLSGRTLQGGRMYGADVETWQSLRCEGGEAARLPIAVAPGDEWLLSGIVPVGAARARTLVLEGSGVEATLIAHRHVCGRVQLPAQGYPEVKGGSAERVYLPAGWADGVCLHVCGIGRGGALTGIRWEEIVS